MKLVELEYSSIRLRDSLGPVGYGQIENDLYNNLLVDLTGSTSSWDDTLELGVNSISGKLRTLTNVT